jgi:hypothetical protein
MKAIEAKKIHPGTKVVPGPFGLPFPAGIENHSYPFKSKEF